MTGEPGGRRELYQFESLPISSVANVVETAIPELYYVVTPKNIPFKWYAIDSRDVRMPPTNILLKVSCVGKAADVVMYRLNRIILSSNSFTENIK